MRIGVNCFSLQHDIGGLRQYFHTLFRELLLNDNLNEYVFFYREQNLIELAHLGNDRWKKNAIQVKTQEEIAIHFGKIDLFFCPFNILWPRPVPVASVMKLADIQERYYPQFFTHAELAYRDRHYQPSTIAADYVITDSDFSKKSLIQYHHLCQDKIVPIHLAVDKSFLDRGACRIGSLALPERFIFYPANGWHHKNHDNLLKALRFLKTDHRLVIPCVLTGCTYKGFGYNLQEKIHEYQLAEQVTLHGYVTDEEIKYLYHNAEMLCFPSLFEGFGIPLVEGMISGCPVVCSNAASIPEIVDNGGLFFDPDDPKDIAEKIKYVWESKEVRQNLVERGKARGTNFTVESMASNHLKVFDLAFEAHKSLHGSMLIPSQTAVPIATSIAPGRTEVQKEAIQSWQQLGFDVISINSAEEIRMLEPLFPGVSFVESHRNALADAGKPFIFFDDVLAVLAESGAQVCGIVNSDIYLKPANKGFHNFIKASAASSFILGARVDIESLDILSGEEYFGGFDFFFFDRCMIPLYPQSKFALGVPWWDFWAPLVPIINGITIKQLITPCAYHVNHSTNWTLNLLEDFGRRLADYLTQDVMMERLDADLSSNSSASKFHIDVAPFNIFCLYYIKYKSTKVSYGETQDRDQSVNLSLYDYNSNMDKLRFYKLQFHQMRKLLQAREGNSAEVKKCLKQCQKTLDCMYKSFSWHVTQPLRWMRRRFNLRKRPLF